MTREMLSVSSSVTERLFLRPIDRPSFILLHEYHEHLETPSSPLDLYGLQCDVGGVFKIRSRFAGLFLCAK